MPTKIKKFPEKGGYIARNAKTGRFVAVGTSAGEKKVTDRTVKSVKGASERRKSALKRLADR